MEEYNKSINEFEINIKNLLNVLSTNLLLQVEEIKKELDIEVKKYEIIKNIDEENKKFIQNIIEKILTYFHLWLLEQRNIE